jgi:hypothetical protein
LGNSHEIPRCTDKVERLPPALHFLFSQKPTFTCLGILCPFMRHFPIVRGL